MRVLWVGVPPGCPPIFRREVSAATLTERRKGGRHLERGERRSLSQRRQEPTPLSHTSALPMPASCAQGLHTRPDAMSRPPPVQKVPHQHCPSDTDGSTLSDPRVQSHGDEGDRAASGPWPRGGRLPQPAGTDSEGRRSRREQGPRELGRNRGRPHRSRRGRRLASCRLFSARPGGRSLRSPQAPGGGCSRRSACSAHG